jgi:hypothetical protein
VDTITYAPTQKSKLFNNFVDVFLVGFGGIFALAGCLFTVVVVTVFPLAALVTCLASTRREFASGHPQLPVVYCRLFSTQ